MLDAHLNNRLSNHPPFGGFDATTAASSRLTALIEVFGVVGTARVFALIEA
ncbi:unknow (plasmid) [Vibrio parahaemolyticus]|nr:unknow [Vibrio parahaemolyticus]